MRSSPRAGPERVGLGAVASHPETDVGGQARHRLEQHRQALARLVATHEEDRRALGGPGCRLGEPLHVDAVVHEHVLAAERVVRHAAGVLGDRAPQAQAPGRVPGARSQPLVGGAPARGVEGADHRRGVEQEGGHRGPGNERLVQVHDVELLVAQGADRAQGTGGIGRDRGHRAVGGQRDAVAQGGDADVGRGPVAGTEHPGGMAEGTQGPRQGEHLGLHPAGQREAVGAHQRDAHWHVSLPFSSGRPPGPTVAASKGLRSMGLPRFRVARHARPSPADDRRPRPRA